MGEPTDFENELRQEVNQVLAAENPVLLAARRLLELAQDAIHDVSHEVHLPEGIGRDLVFRSIAVRTHDTLSSVLHLVEAGASHHARLLLRPLVEDHIFLGWLRTLHPEVADKFLRLKACLETARGCEDQRRFLPSAYASLGVEPVPAAAAGLGVPQMTGVVQDVENQLRELGRPFGWAKGGPSVKAMAESAGRTAEYEFFYRATSRSVHSNLHEMARMVWGDARSMTMTITSQALAVVHSEFSAAYGVWFYGEVLSELSAPFRA